MKTLLLTGFLIITLACYPQSNDLTFDYDSAGNQIIRELICINCDEPASRPLGSKNQDFVQSTEYDEVSFFPNPVQEELYIKWTRNDTTHVTDLQVYSMSGQLLISKGGLSNETKTSVNFSNLAEGIYSVLLFYNNGDKKALKVIKK